MAKECLYCGLQFSETTTFCPDCGRPTASGFKICPTQEIEVDRLRREIKGKDELIRRLVLSRTGKLPLFRLVRELGKFFLAVYPLFRQAVAS